MPKILFENQELEKNDSKNRLWAGGIVILGQGCMNHGPKFLLETVGDAPKKFHDPGSIFWVSNNSSLKTVRPKIAEIADFRPFFNLWPVEKLKYGPEILPAHVRDPNYVLWKKHGMSKKNLRYLNLKKKFFLGIVEKKWCHYPPYCQPILKKILLEVLHIMDFKIWAL